MPSITRANSFESTLLALDEVREDPSATARALGQIRAAMAPLARPTPVATRFPASGRSLGELAAQMDAGQIERFVGELPTMAQGVANIPAPGMAGMIVRALSNFGNAAGNRAGVRALVGSTKMVWNDDGDRAVRAKVVMR